MTKFKSLFAAAIVAASFNSVAADWNMVSSSAEEQVFVDSQSIIKDTDNLMQVRILENFADTRDMGHVSTITSPASCCWPLTAWPAP